LGKPVRLVSFKLDDCVLCQSRLISLFGITLRFSECGVTKNGHDHLSCCTVLCETTASRLAQSMRSATKWKSRFRYCIAHPLTEAVDCERPAKHCRQDGDVLALCGANVATKSRSSWISSRHPVFCCETTILLSGVMCDHDMRT
jgi:hypothetical protein